MIKRWSAILVVSVLVSALTSFEFIYNFKSSWEKNFKQTKAMRFVDYQDENKALINDARFAGSAPTSFTRAASLATPCVVNIMSKATTDFDIWNMDSGTSTGSGVIVSADGYIITNRHVIEGAKEIKVTLADNREFRAKVIGQDPSSDIALIKINSTKLQPILFGNSDSLMVGEWVLAVGNPFNLSSTVTAGIVSAKGRSIDILDDAYRIESFIQTDAAVNPGNSGGALVNTAGNLVGINTAIITKSGRYEGYSFAVPSSVVKKVMRDLLEFGKVQRAILGISPEDVTNDLAKSLSLPEVAGVYVGRVNPGGSAEKAGLKNGDVIVSIDNKRIISVPKLQEVLATYRPSNVVDVVYFRGGQKFKTEVILQNRLNDTQPILAKNDEVLDQIGLELREVSSKEKTQFSLSGAVVQSIRRQSVVDKTNMEAGFIITRINEIKVNSVSQAINEIKKARGAIRLDGVYAEYPGRYSYEFDMN